MAAVALGGGEIAQGVRLPVLFPDAPTDCQRVRQGVDGLVGLAQAAPRVAHPFERHRLTGQIGDRDADGQRLLMKLECSRVLTHRVVGEADRVE